MNRSRKTQARLKEPADAKCGSLGGPVGSGGRVICPNITDYANRCTHDSAAEIFDRMLEVLAAKPDVKSVMIDASMSSTRCGGKKGKQIASHRKIATRLRHNPPYRRRSLPSLVNSHAKGLPYST